MRLQARMWFPLVLGFLLVACADPAGSTNHTGTDATGQDSSTDTVGSDGLIGSDATGNDQGPDFGTPPPPDDDGDTIGNADEGDGLVNTDGDATPDSLDNDSDGDGISDADEAGDNEPRTPPVDTDGDLTPDFQDTDSDGNGILDSVELTIDSDGDGQPNFRDTDNDGDGIHDGLEIQGGAGDCNRDGLVDAAGTPQNPWDCNSDGIPDYMTDDADGDFISDRIEGLNTDSDKDAFLDRYDTDSDNDGISDANEAGDTNTATAPRDTDADGMPDFRDVDSDNDGILDSIEIAEGTNPINGDSDNDGVSDLIELTAGTDPLNNGDNPRARGDFVFLIPYQAATSPSVDTLEFATSIQFADLYFGFDTTGSMDVELASMANTTNGVPAIINQLRCPSTGGACANDGDCLTGVCFSGSCIQDPAYGAGCVPDMYTGVGVFDELNTFRNIIGLQGNPASTANNIPGTGGGGAEAPYQPPYCVANRSACGSNCASTGIGCAGFRSNAIRIYIQITDADNQCSGGGCGNYTGPGAGAALLAQQIKFIGLWGTGDDGGVGTPQSVANEIGIGSGSVNSGGQPFVYPAIDAAVVTQTVQAVRDIARGVPLNVTIGATDLPGDDGDALQFIDYLQVNVSGTGSCTAVANVLDTNGDAHPDSFPSLLPGTPVCWDVHPVLQNTTVPAAFEPKIFKAQLTVYGDGSPLDSRDVFFLLPPDIAGNIN